MFMRLAKPDSRVDAQALRIDAGGETARDPLTQEFADFGNDVGVARILLHRRGLALHVHQADSGARARGGRERALATQRTHVIDELRACSDGGSHDGRVAGIDRYRHSRLARQPLDHGHDTATLLVTGRRDRARSRRLAADVDDRGTRLDHRERAVDRGRRIGVQAVMGE